MWLWMTVGREPFRLNVRGELELRLSPVLSNKLFDAKGRFECAFLGGTRLMYVNPRKRSTFGAGRVTPKTIRLQPRTGQPVGFDSGVIPAPYALMVRDGNVARIEVTLGL